MKIFNMILRSHRSPYRKPYWKIALSLPFVVLYFPAVFYVEWCDEYLADW